MRESTRAKEPLQRREALACHIPHAGLDIRKPSVRRGATTSSAARGTGNHLFLNFLDEVTETNTLIQQHRGLSSGAGDPATSPGRDGPGRRREAHLRRLGQRSPERGGLVRPMGPWTSLRDVHDGTTKREGMNWEQNNAGSITGSKWPRDPYPCGTVAPGDATGERRQGGRRGRQLGKGRGVSRAPAGESALDGVVDRTTDCASREGDDTSSDDASRGEEVGG